MAGSPQPLPKGKAMKFIPALCVAAALLVGPPAQAVTLDLSTITCKNFFENIKGEQLAIIMSWLHGYYRDEKDPPVINTDDFTKDMTKLAGYCGSNPDIGLITAADKTLGK
jgi:acid stress chaperone HdeB